MQEQSLKSLVAGLFDEFGRLVRQEIRLAQAEMAEKASQAQAAALSIVSGLLLAFAALLVLLQALVLALATVMPPAVAAILVGLSAAVAAFALVRRGQNKLGSVGLVPERTIAAVRNDRDMIMEKVK